MKIGDGLMEAKFVVERVRERTVERKQSLLVYATDMNRW